MSRWLRAVRWALVVTLVAGTMVAGPASVAQAEIVPPDFTEEIVFAGLSKPTNIEFAADGRVFVAEKNGLIKVFASVDDPTFTVFADLTQPVNSYWDRGLLGLALAPNFPTDPYVYVLYTYDAPPGQVAPVWNDVCDQAECPVTGRLSRLRADGNVMTGSEQVLIHDWCQQFGSHSLGDLQFGPDGALYASAGEGASFSVVDYGQAGSPPNVCADPPAAGGLTPPTAEGGALRAQDVRTTGDPTGLGGSMIRIDPVTGAAWPNNPLSASSDANARRLAAYGLRNPFRFALRPGTNEVWVADVGANTYEEIDRIMPSGGSGSPLPNYGWPCYEGPGRSAFESAGLTLCQSLYNGAGQTGPYLSYAHGAAGPADCPKSGGAAVSGMAFYPSGPAAGTVTYPARYYGALFFADYTRRCITVMRAPTPTGTPSASLVETFDTGAATPVDLALGPRGELYYADLSGGTVRRYRYSGTGNHPPVAAATVSAAALTATFDASGSSDLDLGDHLSYGWDFGDGVTQPASASPTASHTYATAGVYSAVLTVTDLQGASDTLSLTVAPGKSMPVGVIDTPVAATTWSVGQTVTFTGHATDADAPGGPNLPASAMAWNLRMNHCYTLDDCHVHYLREWSGVASGSFVAPDHEYPSYLDLELTVTDADGLTHTAVRRLDPATVTVTVTSDPPGAPVALGEFTGITPFTRTVIKGSTQTLSAGAVHLAGDALYRFRSWSDAGAATHVIATATNSTVKAQYTTNGMVNLARGRTATADSSCSPEQVPARAVNGSTTGGPGDRWCSAGANKWLMIDLRQSEQISGIVVYHAGAGGEDPTANTRDFTLTVSDDGTTWRPLATVTGNTQDITTHLENLTARYVRLGITVPTGSGGAEAHIYEVKIFGVPPRVPVPPGPVNLALGRPATADSQCAADRGPDKAVDGRWTNSFASWCAAGSPSWLMVDLGANTQVGSIALRHAGAGGAPGENTRDFTVQISANGTTWTTKATVTGNTRSLTEHVINATTRYVRVLVTSPGGTAAQLYELEAYPPA